jgi:RNA polymerase sigma factor (sigma-70 family)
MRPLSEERKQLAAQYHPLARKLAAQYSRTQRVDYAICLSAAFEGLVHAAGTWDEQGGAGFMTYASVHIRWRLCDAFGRRSSEWRPSAHGSECLHEVCTTPRNELADEEAFDHLLGLATSKQRQALDLHYRWGWDVPSLASHLGVSRWAASKLLSNGRKTIARALLSAGDTRAAAA